MTRIAPRRILAALLLGALVLGACADPRATEHTASPASPKAARGPADSPLVVAVACFEDAAVGLPPGLKEVTFKRVERSTLYELREEAIGSEKNRYLHATSVRAASAAAVVTSIDLSATPEISFRWRVTTPIACNTTMKEGDDFAARVLIGFAPAPDVGFLERILLDRAAAATGLPAAGTSLCYVWSADRKVGEIWRSPYGEDVAVIAASSGPGGRKWIKVRRNVAADYWAAFRAAPQRIVWIAFMTDTDDSGTTADADWDDLVFTPGSGP